MRVSLSFDLETLPDLLIHQRGFPRTDGIDVSGHDWRF